MRVGAGRKVADLAAARIIEGYGSEPASRQPAAAAKAAQPAITPEQVRQWREDDAAAQERDRQVMLRALGAMARLPAPRGS